jgi:hypothetical protein
MFLGNRTSRLRRAWLIAACVLFALAAPAVSGRGSAWGADHARVDPISWAPAVVATAPAKVSARRAARASVPAHAVAPPVTPLPLAARPAGATLARPRARLYLLHQALLR